MRLTLMLLKRRNIVPGHQWVGKHRLPYVIYPWHTERLSRRLQVEEQNLFYLRHPYLTLEQERTGSRDSAGKYIDLKKASLNQKKVNKAAGRQVQISTRMEEHIGHLNVGTNWETYK